MTAPPKPARTRVVITPRGAYFAKRCPRAIELDVLIPCEPLAPTPVAQDRIDAGDTYEAAIFETLLELKGAVRIDAGEDLTSHIRNTTTAMDKGAPIILGGYLPIDPAGLRTGKPDVLVRHGTRRKSNDKWAYLPVDVKHHMVLTSKGSDGGRVSTLQAPWHSTASELEEGSVWWRWRDICQLAHYHRMLDAHGYAGGRGAWGGIIGSEGMLAWYDLSKGGWDPPLRDAGGGEKTLTALDLYDTEFAYRIDVLSSVLKHQGNRSLPLVADPVVNDDCGTCGWVEWCHHELTQRGELTFLPKVREKERAKYKGLGITDIACLARADPTTALLADAGVNLGDLMDKAACHSPDTALDTLIPRRHTQLDHLAAAGIRTVRDLESLDPVTLSYVTQGVGKLTRMIDAERAWLGTDPVYRKRGVTQVVVPRGDIEIDIDLESDGPATYLWGMLVTDRTTTPPLPGTYHPFASWDPDPVRATTDAFEKLWRALRGIRADARREHKTIKIYCYNKGTEQTGLRRGAELLGRYGAEVEGLIKSTEWVDVLDVVRQHLLSVTQSGLKVIAPLAGFSWRAQDAGGQQSTLFYRSAVTPTSPEREQARAWLLDYNEDDVRATIAVRDWLEQKGPTLPKIADQPAPA